MKLYRLKKYAFIKSETEVMEERTGGERGEEKV
jgi:hypothetical protein